MENLEKLEKIGNFENFRKLFPFFRFRKSEFFSKIKKNRKFSKIFKNFKNHFNMSLTRDPAEGFDSRALFFQLSRFFDHEILKMIDFPLILAKFAQIAIKWCF